MSSHKDKIAKFAQTLEEWDYKLDRLEHRVKDLPDEIQSVVEKKYQKLLDIRDSLKEKEEEFKHASENAIDDIEESIEEVVDTFKLLFEDVEVRSKIEGL